MRLEENYLVKTITATKCFSNSLEEHFVLCKEGWFVIIELEYGNYFKQLASPMKY